MKQLLIIMLAALVGCASIPELTPAEVTKIHQSCSGEAVCIINTTDAAIAAKIQQLEYEAEDRRIRRRDELIVFLNACDNTKGMVVVEFRRLGKSKLPDERVQRRSRRDYGYAYTHNNVSPRLRKHDVRCVNLQDFKRMLERAGL